MRKEILKTSDERVIFEGLTSVSAVIRAMESETHTNKRRIEKILYDPRCERKNQKNLTYLRAKSKQLNFEMESATADTIDEMTLGNSHGGIIAFCSNREIPCLNDAAGDLIRNDGFYVMIEGIEDPYNFGYALRSLYACGVDGVVLDNRNWMSAAGIVARSSAGASESLDLFTAEATDAVQYFKNRGYLTVCADKRTDHYLHETPLPLPVFLIVGGERRGISRTLLDQTDLKVKIAYGRNFGGSLSAASACAMMAYEIFRQNADALMHR